MRQVIAQRPGSKAHRHQALGGAEKGRYGLAADPLDPNASSVFGQDRVSHAQILDRRFSFPRRNQGPGCKAELVDCSSTDPVQVDIQTKGIVYRRKSGLGDKHEEITILEDRINLPPQIERPDIGRVDETDMWRDRAGDIRAFELIISIRVRERSGSFRAVDIGSRWGVPGYRGIGEVCHRSLRLFQSCPVCGPRPGSLRRVLSDHLPLCSQGQMGGPEFSQRGRRLLLWRSRPR